MTASDIITIRGVCPHDCPDTCATLVDVRRADGQAIAFRGDPDHPITNGWLCAKVRPYLDRVYHPDRLLHPLRRVGPKGAGQWERISWDEALSAIAARWQAIIAEYGGAAILPYSYSGTLGLLQNVIAASRLMNRIGASGLERSICDAASNLALELTYGSKQSQDPRDVLHSKLIILWGHNPASTAPHFVPLLRAAQRKGAYVVVIDPRRTLTARSADEHIQPRPATDAALALGLMHVLFRDGLHNEAWLEEHTHGWRALRERAAEYPPQHVAAITSVPEETIVALARRWGTTTPALLKFADGVQRHGNGGQTVRALACLPAITGQVGVQGGGLAYSTSGYAAWDAAAIGHSDACPPTPRMVNMVRLGAALNGEVSDPPIKSLFVFNANPVASTPNSSLIIEGLLRDDLFTVVHELFLTDTARYADIVLPATSQLEQPDLHKAYGHRFLQYNAPAIAPRGEARSNWDTMRALAAAMGYTEPWLHQEPDEALREVLDASRANLPVLEGITLERLKAEGRVPLNFSAVPWVPFADFRFPTPSGKIELYSEQARTHGIDPLPCYTPPAEFSAQRDDTLVLLSGAAHHYVSSSLANIPKLMRLEGPPQIELNPSDAARFGICDGSDVRVENARGWCTLRAVVTTDVPPGVAVSPKGPWAQHSPDQRNVNWVTPDALADIAGQSTFHSNIVRVRPVASG
ncbi:MAG: molybdopterin oxidoreductase [Chloroflexi bacterium]|nr:MAG: molybdopterin oxidoreductase [Chloroflexota bacterium]